MNAPTPNRKNQFQARLDNQKAQLERHGNFAEVVIRTTPEGTDMINFARLWEYVLVQADRQTRGYVAKGQREDFEETRKSFDDSIEFMVTRLQAATKRHNIDLAGSNFISRVAQRYSIAERKRKNPNITEKAPDTKAEKPKQETAKTAQNKPETTEKPAKATPKTKKASATKKEAPTPTALDDVVDL